MDIINTRIVTDLDLVVVKDRVEGLNRRADRLGVDRLVLQVEPLAPIVDEIGDEVPQFRVTVLGNVPRVDGWELAAVVRRDNIIGSLTQVFHGPYSEEDYSAYRGTFRCDHCGTNRQRAMTFILRKGDETKVVGRNCLEDFTRSSVSLFFAEACTTLSEDHEPGNGIGDGAIELHRFLSLVNAATAAFGWMSRTKADGVRMATADIVLLATHGRQSDPEVRGIREAIEVTDNHRRLACEAITWARGLDSNNEYQHTIKSIAEAGETNRRLAGYAASICSAYQRELDRRAARENQREQVFLGEPCKTRDLGEVTIKRVRYTEGFYGTKTIVSMEQVVGDCVAPIVWFASGSHEFEEGETLKLRGAIKACEESEKWGKQTVVTRCKFSEIS